MEYLIAGMLMLLLLWVGWGGPDDPDDTPGRVRTA